MLLNPWRKQKTHDVVGLDIGANFIKLLKINSTDSPFKIENFAIEPTPAGAIVKGVIKDAAAIGTILKSMFQQQELTETHVALAIPRSAVIIKNIMIDSRLTPDEIESRAWIEANRHFPELVGNIYLDFMISDPTAQNTGQLELTLYACRKEQVDPYLDVLQAGSLTPQIVDINSFALERALTAATRNTPPSETIALLNIDFTLSTFIVTSNRNLTYAYDQSFDGLRLFNQTQEFQKKHDPQPEITTDETNTSYYDILKENLSAHLRHTMHVFYSSRPNITIQKLILGGDCANIANLAIFVQKELGIETHIANPFTNMSINPRVNQERLNNYAPSLLLSCGLALSKI